MQLSDKFIWNYFGMPNEKEQENFSYAITPYESKQEYLKDVELLKQYNSSGNPQTKFLMIHAAKVERSDKSIFDSCFE